MDWQDCMLSIKRQRVGYRCRYKSGSSISDLQPQKSVLKISWFVSAPCNKHVFAKPNTCTMFVVRLPAFCTSVLYSSTGPLPLWRQFYIAYSSPCFVSTLTLVLLPATEALFADNGTHVWGDNGEDTRTRLCCAIGELLRANPTSTFLAGKVSQLLPAAEVSVQNRDT